MDICIHICIHTYIHTYIYMYEYIYLYILYLLYMYIVKSWRQSSAPILLIITMALWRHAGMDGHVVTKLLWWWRGWAHWIVFMTSLYMYYALSFVLVEHSVCHEPVFVLSNVYICIHIYIYIYIYIHIYTYII